MKKQRFGVVIACFAVLAALVTILLLNNGLRRSSHIVLPDAVSSAAAGSADAGRSDSLVEIEITPQTVQKAIATLSRPESYVRTITAETLWSGGSGTQEITSAVSGGYTRTDVVQTDGRTRHSITDGETTYVWYGSGKALFSAPAADITADDEQHIPTYEDILTLDPAQIAQADYRSYSNENCIYVETVQDADGYSMHYWISVASGLLTGAERLYQGAAILRVTAGTVSDQAPTTADFTLPDGTVLVKDLPAQGT
jgi:hypothetical protein